MANGVTYRQMRPEDEDAVFALWMATWTDSDEALERQTLHTDPDYTSRTYIAVGEDGQVLSTVHYWVREMCGAVGTPRRVGCVSHVSTHHIARRQGHARTLMSMLQDAMAADGCEYTFLFSSEMGVPLYEGLGYRTMNSPYRRGLVQRDRPAPRRRYTVTEAREPDWDDAAGIYAAYNAGRPLAFVRDEAYWREYLAPKWRQALNRLDARALTAREGAEGEPVAYALMYFSTPEVARQYFGLDQVFTICELCALPGHDAAIPVLVDVVAALTPPGEVGGRVFAPRESAPSAIEALFGATLHEKDDRLMMVRPLNDGLTYADLEAIFASSASVFWMLDEF
jgi:ribosomal protein S18 acetylase RimI-like enzyme